MKKHKPLCSICGKVCEMSDRNTDGTYAHSACLMVNMTRPGGKE